MTPEAWRAAADSARRWLREVKRPLTAGVMGPAGWINTPEVAAGLAMGLRYEQLTELERPLTRAEDKRERELWWALQTAWEEWLLARVGASRVLPPLGWTPMTFGTAINQGFGDEVATAWEALASQGSSGLS